MILNNKFLRFIGKLTLTLVIVIILHVSFLHFKNIILPIELLSLGYGVNFLLALGIYYLLLYYAERKSAHLGFLFLFGSALKFLVYFVIFNPLFQKDGQLSKLEFFTFFLPYFVCLIIETISLVKLLNKID